MTVFSITGKRVHTAAAITSGDGTGSVVWDGRSDSGRTVASGIYAAAVIEDGRISRHDQDDTPEVASPFPFFLARPHSGWYLSLMKRVALTVLTAAAVMASGWTAAGGESIKGREILGVRLGGIHSTSGLDEAFGSGSELEVYFYHGLSPSSALGVSLSMHDFGKSLLREKDLEYLGIQQTVEYSVYSLTGGLMTKADLSKKIRVSGEAGGGLYASTAEIPAGPTTSGRITYNQLGAYVGGEICWRVTRGGMHIGLGGKWHYMWTGTDYRQVVWVYTGEDYAHFFEVTIGISFYTDN